MQILLFIWLIAISIFGLMFAVSAIRFICMVAATGLKAMTEGDRRIREAYGLEEPIPKRTVNGNVIHSKEFGRR